MLKHRILACLLMPSATAAMPAALSQTTADYAANVAASDRSSADRKLDTNRAPAQWLAFIGAKPGTKILDNFAVYGRKAELLARAVAPSAKFMPKIRKLPLRASRIVSMRGSRAQLQIISSRWCGPSRTLRHPICMTSIW